MLNNRDTACRETVADETKSSLYRDLACCLPLGVELNHFSMGNLSNEHEGSEDILSCLIREFIGIYVVLNLVVVI